MTHFVPENHRVALEARADALIEIGRYADALPVLFDALRQEPGQATLLCRVSLCHYSLRDYPAALNFARQAIHTAPDEEWGYRLQTSILLSRGHPRHALASAETAAHLEPQNEQTLYTLIRAQIYAGKRRQATQTALALRELSPNSLWTHEALALVALSMRRWREAEAHCRMALKINPLSYSTLNNLGLACCRMRRTKEAVLHFYKAARLMPINPVIKQNLLSAMRAYLLDTPLTIIGVLFVLVLVNVNNPPAGEPPAAYHIEALTGLGIAGFTFTAFYLFRLHRIRLLTPQLRQWICAHRKQLLPGSSVVADHQQKTTLRANWKRLT